MASMARIGCLAWCDDGAVARHPRRREGTPSARNRSIGGQQDVEALAAAPRRELASSSGCGRLPERPWLTLQPSWTSIAQDDCTFEDRKWYLVQGNAGLAGQRKVSNWITARPNLLIGIEANTAIETAADRGSRGRTTGRGRILYKICDRRTRNHAPFGGVVTEIAARAHVDALDALSRGR